MTTPTNHSYPLHLTHEQVAEAIRLWIEANFIQAGHRVTDVVYKPGRGKAEPVFVCTVVSGEMPELPPLENTHRDVYEKRLEKSSE